MFFDIVQRALHFIMKHFFLHLQPSSHNYMDRMLGFLSAKILETDCTVEIRDRFPSLLLLIVTKAFPITDDVNSARQNDLHQKKCIAFGKLVNFSPDILQSVKQ